MIMHILLACYISDCCSKAHHCFVVDGWAPLIQQRRQLEHTTQQLVLSVGLLPGVTSLWRKVKNVLRLHPYPTVSTTLSFVVNLLSLCTSGCCMRKQTHCMPDVSVLSMVGMNACMTQCANTSVPADSAWQAEPADKAPVVCVYLLNLTHKWTLHACKVNAGLHGKCSECMPIAVDVRFFAKMQTHQILLNQPVSKGPASYAPVS